MKLAAFLSLSLMLLASANADKLADVPAKRVVRPSVIVPGTPPNLNASVTIRYGSDKPKVILFLMPGYLGGAGSFDRLARQIVALDPSIAVWAVDRRANLLEPQGTVARANPDMLAKMVQEGLPVLPPSKVAFMSDWGLDVTLKDWRTVIQEAQKLTPNVYLGGHSLGAALTGLYAAYDFAGKRGYNDVKGLVMLDGYPGLLSGNPVTRREYDTGASNAIGPIPGLNTLKSNPYVNEFYYGPSLASKADAQARLATLYPDAAAPKSSFIAWPATNLAAAVSTISQRYATIPFLAITAGRATNVGEKASILPRLIGGKDTQQMTGPLDKTKLIGWEKDAATLTDPNDFAKRFWTPLSDAIEWYFPQRLMLDVAAARTDTRGTIYEKELPVWYNAAVTLPVLGISGENGVTKEADFQRYAAAHLDDLTTHTFMGAAHLDMTFAQDDQVARWIVAWLEQNDKDSG